jgi:predicted DNA-binding protein (MmcQ/YjbR family)
MDIEWVRQFCLSLPHTTEVVQWQDHLVFKVGGKIYAVAALEPVGNFLSLKCTPEESAEMTEREGVVPAPYLARAHWIALEHEAALPQAEVKRLLRQAYELVFAKLPRKTREVLDAKAQRRAAKKRR